MLQALAETLDAVDEDGGPVSGFYGLRLQGRQVTPSYERFYGSSTVSE